MKVFKMSAALEPIVPHALDEMKAYTDEHPLEIVKIESPKETLYALSGETARLSPKVHHYLGGSVESLISSYHGSTCSERNYLPNCKNDVCMAGMEKIRKNLETDTEL